MEDWTWVSFNTVMFNFRYQVLKPWGENKEDSHLSHCRCLVNYLIADRYWACPGTLPLEGLLIASSDCWLFLDMWALSLSGKQRSAPCQKWATKVRSREFSSIMTPNSPLANVTNLLYLAVLKLSLKPPPSGTPRQSIPPDWHCHLRCYLSQLSRVLMLMTQSSYGCLPPTDSTGDEKLWWFLLGPEDVSGN